jgi:hypothetical protein
MFRTRHLHYTAKCVLMRLVMSCRGLQQEAFAMKGDILWHTFLIFPFALVHLLLMILDTATAFPSSSVCLNSDAPHLHPARILQSLPPLLQICYFHNVAPRTARQRYNLADNRSFFEYVYDVFAFEDMRSVNKSVQGWKCCTVHALHQPVPGPNSNTSFLMLMSSMAEY